MVAIFILNSKFILKVYNIFCSKIKTHGNTGLRDVVMAIRKNILKVVYPPFCSIIPAIPPILAKSSKFINLFKIIHILSL